MRSIGKIISENRKKKGLSQPELASALAQCGIKTSYKSVSNWERNFAEPSVSAFYQICKILDITDMYAAYFGVNPDDPLSSLTDEGKEKALDYIDLLLASGKYQKEQERVTPFLRTIDVFDNAASAGTGNFLTDGPRETFTLSDDLNVPAKADFGVRISGDSMLPDYENGQIAWVHRQDTLEDGETGIFALNGEAYIKKLKTGPSGTFLVSLNKKYAPLSVGKDDRLDIFGKVIGKGDATGAKDSPAEKN